MLVLRRRHQEAVVVTGTSDIDPTLRIVVLEVNGATVKLGFEAGREVLIHRDEVWKRIRIERQLEQRHLTKTLSSDPRTEFGE